MVQLSVVVVIFLAGVDSAKILGVFPIPSISHQVVFRALTQELAKRGHELFIITPNPVLPRDRPPGNVIEVDVGFSYEHLNKLVKESQKMLKRGVISDVSTVNKEAYVELLHLVKEELNHPEIKKLIDNKNQTFDLILVEAFINYPLIFSNFFDAPVIQFSSFYGTPENFEIVGAVNRHPILYPNVFRNKFRDLTLWEKINEIYIDLKLRREFGLLEQEENKMFKQQFGPGFPTVAELKQNVEMLFVNSHPIMDNNRPVPPNVVYLGALHLLPIKALPEDLKTFLDNSTHGVVYVSLGTNVHPSNMDEDFLNVFLDTFEALPYDVLWKFDGDNLKRTPKNVKIEKWFPQRDLLTHPNVKVFVTQGGLQSTDEAIDAAVPLVGIPMLGDQWYNVHKYMELGIGMELDAMTVTTDELINAVTNVIENESYKRNIVRLRTIIKDQPQTSLERAVWWTEHVLRHRGARHLRSPAANISWIDYFLLDVIVTTVLVITVILALICSILYYILKWILYFWRSYESVKIKIS